MKPLAITGVGVVSPLGVGRAALESAFSDPDAARERAFAGTSTVLDPTKHPDTLVAEVWGYDPNEHLGDKGHRNLDRLTKYLITAGKLALEDAGVKRGKEFVSTLKPEQVGVCSSTAYGSLDSITELNLVAELEDPRYINPARFPNTVINAAAGYVSIWEDLRAPNATIVDGNCGALDAVLAAETHLAHRRADALLVGGGDVLTEPLTLALRRLGAVAQKDAPWAPGERTSKGIRMGEGAAYLFVERDKDATARGATVRARLAGYATAFDPPRREGSLLHASSAAVTRAVQGALRDASLEAKDVDVVATAFGGLPPFDAAERAGLAEVFGDRACLAMTKAIWGESFAGSPALAMASAVSWIEGANVAPLASGSAAAPARVEHVVVTAVGYYGNVSAVVVSR
ncbi:MAG: beta-ketoacyl synthase N-terminal-like domain-containing protein [Sandaracinaceae bacterium]